ncbi:hypothetical protein ACF8QD_07135 [Aeromonas media]|uniref:hypothetical protein n=1 Tax=Aeromonas media TaxID=651 RepID=UPI00370B8AF0
MMNTINNMDPPSCRPRIITTLIDVPCHQQAAHFLADLARTATTEHVKENPSVNQRAFAVGYMDGFTDVLMIARNELLAEASRREQESAQ